MSDEPPPIPLPSCQNCGADLSGDYCSACGQRDIDFRRDWKGLVHEFASSLLNLDGKTAHGIVDLLFRPGELTRTFLSGKRASQIPPLRLYLFVSLLFFIWLQGGTGDEEAVLLGDPAAQQIALAEAELEDGDSDALGRWIEEKIRRREAIGELFMIWLPRAFLVGIPVMALVTRLLFIGRRRVYLEHIVMALHFQSGAMLMLMVAAGWGHLLMWVHPFLRSAVMWAAAAWIMVYPVIALRKIFALRWGGAIGFASLLELAYLGYLGLALVGVATFAVLLA